MGAQLPKKYADSEISRLLISQGMQRLHQGKVRDTFALPNHPDLLFLVATNRLSIFDFVLPGLVPDKGAVLTALTVFWMTNVLKGIEHHLVAFGSGIDEFLPEAARGNKELQAHAMIVRKLDMLPIECVVRGYLTGSGWGAYKRGGEVCGHKLAENLHDGSKLPAPIFTPTTKAEEGHDEHISFESVRADFGMEPENWTLNVYGQLHDHARNHGIILADTKFEFGKGGVLGDEVGTPDSSRFWDIGEWEVAVKEQRSPVGYDKQPVREWGKTIETPFSSDGAAIVGIHKLDTEDAEHLQFVHEQIEVPADVLAATTKRYRAIFERLTEQKLEDFQRDTMKIV